MATTSEAMERYHHKIGGSVVETLPVHRVPNAPQNQLAYITGYSGGEQNFTGILLDRDIEDPYASLRELTIWAFKMPTSTDRLSMMLPYIFPSDEPTANNIVPVAEWEYPKIGTVAGGFRWYVTWTFMSTGVCEVP
jgi:hypothetical protein